ncbi:hypothetical protein [Paraglaciecola marina]|uniref:hypothetical protein n=1 Tax=Paraglaciecola marina TaxID=2500157 RepID=UPI00105FE75F|nr:hypothetical protein [Paraglaciecola marina]
MTIKSFLDSFEPPEFGKFLVLAFITPLAMVACWANLESNLMATYEPVFLDAPYKADLLALLAPISAMAFKAILEFFKTKQGKYRFKITLGFTSAVTALLWLISWAYVFNGIGTGEEAAPASDAAAKFYMFIHTLTEILATSVLYIALFDLLEEKFPKPKFLNPHYRVQLAKVNTLKEEVAALEERYKLAVAAEAHHKNSREAFIKEQEAAFALEVMRHETFFN